MPMIPIIITDSMLKTWMFCHPRLETILFSKKTSTGPLALTAAISSPLSHKAYLLEGELQEFHLNVSRSARNAPHRAANYKGKTLDQS